MAGGRPVQTIRKDQHYDKARYGNNRIPILRYCQYVTPTIRIVSLEGKTHTLKRKIRIA